MTTTDMKVAGHVIYMRCPTCSTRYRLERLTPTTVVGVVPRYCPTCSASALVEFNPEEDYWRLLAVDYGFGPTAGPLIKQLFESWDGRQHSHFKSFVKELMKEALLGDSDPTEG